jgi:hypothetical protein
MREQLHTADGRVDRAAVMRKAHANYRDAMQRGWEGWTFGRCLRMAIHEGKGRRDIAAARGEFIRASLIERLAPAQDSVARYVDRFVG